MAQHRRSWAKRMALATAALLLVMLTTVAAPTPEAGAIDRTPVSIDDLNMIPERTWGVSGQTPEQTQTPTLDVLVWDFAQIGNRMFIGGAFLNVQESKYSTPIEQSYVAAFDVNTGEWISTWRPLVDRAVYALDVTPDGSLLVGGEFTTVNGTAREGLVALNPQTGQIDSSWQGAVERPWSSSRAMVRDIEVVGDITYVAGNFSHITGSGNGRARVYKAGRFTDASGTIDSGWTPEVTGSGVWGIDIDPALGEVSMAGYFSAVNGEASSGYFHTVNDTDGATAAGKIEVPRNYPGTQPEFFDVTYGNDLVFAIGEQHIVQVLESSNHNMIGFHTTGLYDGFHRPGGFAGGAFQVGERIGDIIFAGCHCTYSERYGNLSHYTSFTAERTAHRLIMAYDANTGHLIENFVPDFHSPRDGAWAVGSDTNGCLYVGGDFHVGGVDNDQARWLGGFGKFCPDGNGGGGGGGDDLVSAGSDWAYVDNGADLGTAWRTAGYNDAGWAVGTAEFGFGDGDEETLWEAGHVTYYARHSFEFTGDRPSSLNLDLAADDGAVVYLNGVEILRDNMPNGTITASTEASIWRAGGDEKLQSHTVSADALVEGTNVLAVEVHNVWSGNNDLSFDLRLNPSDQAPPEPEPGQLVEAGTAWAYSQAGTEPGGWPGGLEGADEGLAEFGFGDRDEATELDSGMKAYYFSKTFTVADPAAYEELTLGLTADDGALVFINGVEVLRVNMPAGAVDYDTAPLTWIGGKDEKMQFYTVSSDALVAGQNTVAVEVHNYWKGNSDLSFDLELE